MPMRNPLRLWAAIFLLGPALAGAAKSDPITLRVLKNASPEAAAEMLRMAGGGKYTEVVSDSEHDWNPGARIFAKPVEVGSICVVSGADVSFSPFDWDTKGELHVTQFDAGVYYYVKGNGPCAAPIGHRDLFQAASLAVAGDAIDDIQSAVGSAASSAPLPFALMVDCRGEPEPCAGAPSQRAVLRDLDLRSIAAVSQVEWPGDGAFERIDFSPRAQSGRIWHLRMTFEMKTEWTNGWPAVVKTLKRVEMYSGTDA